MRISIVLSSVLLCLALERAHADQFVYVHDRVGGGNNQVLAFALGKNGSLTPVAGSQGFAMMDGGDCSGSCQTIAYSKNRKMLFATGTGGVATYQVATDGALTPALDSPHMVAAGASIGVAVVDIGKRTFCYLTSPDQDVVDVREVLADGSFQTVSGSPYSLADEPSAIVAAKNHLLVCGLSDASVHSLLVGSDGALSALTPIGTVTGATFFNLQLSRDGKFAYHANGTNIVRTMRVDAKSGALSYVGEGPIGLSLVNAPVATIPGNKLLVVLGGNLGQNIEGFQRDGKSGQLVTLHGGASGLGTQLHAGDLDKTDKFLVVADGVSVRSLAIKIGGNPKTMTLTPIDTEPGGAFVSGVKIVER